MGKSVILLGASGLTGSHVLQYVLIYNSYDEVILFNRSALGVNHPKIKEYVIDLLDLKSQEQHFKADIVICCIGTTKAKTPDKTLYKQIDYGIPVAAAELCVLNNISKFLVISSLGADENSKVFYSKTKGEMEAKVLSLGITSTNVLQPSLISGQRNEKRAGEFAAKLFMKVINPLLFGRLKKYKSIHPDTIAKALIYLANHEYETGIIPSDKIEELATL
ncbi:MAG: oxidoreductase [Winogradskyella sp.]